MPKKKVEVYNKDQLIYPYIESDHVTFSNGMKVTEMLDQSISMPTVTHENLSFKVGVGNQDVSSAIVDSSVAEMTIKGKTYQNILPEPSTLVLTNNKEMFKVNEGLDPNVEIVDGVSKSAILTGQTLVNVSEINKFTLNVNNREKTTGLNLYKPNTKYLQIMVVTKNTIVGANANGVVGAFNERTTVAQADTGTVLLNENKVGTYINIFTTPSTTNLKLFTNIRIYSNVTGGVLEGYEMIIEYQDGMENWDIPYFEGMQSVKMPVLTTTGKNLFDKENFYNDWKGKQPNYVYKETVDGEEVLKIHNLNLLSDDNKGFKIPVKKGAPLTFSLKCKKAGTNNTGMVLMIRHDDSSYVNVGGCSSDEWVERKVTFTPTRDYITVCSAYNANEYFYIKDIQLEHGTTATTYEPYKTNILSTSEDVVLRGIGDVRDTLDLMTGELAQRIGEVVLDGTQSLRITGTPNQVNTLCILFHNFPKIANGAVMSDKLIKESNYDYSDFECITQNGFGIAIRLLRNKLESADINGVNKFLSQNPITVQYQLETKSVKTVDLSSSGNWEKVVLDGSETGWSNSYSEWANKVFCLNNSYLPNVIKPTSTHDTYVMCDKLRGSTIQWLCAELGRTGVALHSWGAGYLQIAINGVNTVDELKQYLSQNPITVWYQTTNHKDSTQVKQPIFFKDGHIQLSSGADNSLIPTLDYQAKTSNSYVMDLMKTNTKYTMKAKSASGTFTIDGTSYGAGINGTFTTPSSMTNKFLVMSNKTNEEVMILEGDLTSKIIPYFKGIKSAFEDESKIEVLSNSGNLANYLESSFAGGSNLESTNANNELTLIDNTNIPYSFIRTPIYKDFVFKKGRKYHVEFEYVITNARYGQVKIVTPNVAQVTNSINFPISNNWSKFKTTLTPILDFSVNSLKHTEKGVETCLEFVALGGEELSGDKTLKIRNVILSEDDIDYKPYKQNVSKIPLLSPLRSLPNGVCDEIILDREKNKATLIQRVEAIPVTSVDDIRLQANLGRYNRFFIHKRQTTHPTFTMSSIGSQLSNWCPYHTGFTTDSYHFYVDGTGDIMLFDKSETLNSIRTKLSQSPFVALHQLATPIITEVDLEGFPYIYKDGHIFLNSEIVPITEITYSINQCQQISASNEDVIRHEKELTYLQKLIAQYVKVDYESALLSLKV